MNITLAPETLFTIAGLPITNTFFVQVVISLLLILVAFFATRKMKDVPRGIQFWFEVFVDEGIKFMEEVTGSKKQAKLMFPFVMTLFLFFLVANFLPFIPGIGAITYNGVALHRTATSDYSLAFALATVAVVAMQIITIVTGGIWTYFSKYFNFSGPWSMKPINIFLGLMDIISEIAKIISLSFRLFGNMFAGQILAAVIIGLVPYIIPLPFALLGILTAVIQAAVFAILVLIFMSMAVVEKEIAKEMNK